MTKTIVLIHGAWLNAPSWEGFKARYEAKGYTVIAPAWPLDDRTPAELRAHRPRSRKPAERDRRPLRAHHPRAARGSRS